MDSRQQKSNEEYTRLALKNENLCEIAGRYAFDEGKEIDIWMDIKQKLDLKKDQTILDIGCGYGHLTKELIEYSMINSCHLTLLDIPAVVDAIISNFLNGIVPDNISFIKGNFPSVIGTDIKNKKFDRILTYSVVHCTSKPSEFIFSAVPLLKPFGKFLIGDLPNVNKKARFIMSDFGAQFDANYKNITVQELPKYKDVTDFIRQNRKMSNLKINDKLILSLMKKCRETGHEVFVLPQPVQLPFSFTREDVLITNMND